MTEWETVERLKKHLTLVRDGLPGTWPSGLQMLHWLIYRMDDPDWRFRSFYCYNTLGSPSWHQGILTAQTTPTSLPVIYTEMNKDAIYKKAKCKDLNKPYELYIYDEQDPHPEMPARNRWIQVLKQNRTAAVRNNVEIILKNWDSYWLKDGIKLILEKYPVNLEFYDKVNVIGSYLKMVPPLPMIKVSHAVLARDFRKHLQHKQEQELHAKQYAAALRIQRNMRHLYIKHKKVLRLMLLQRFCRIINRRLRARNIKLQHAATTIQCAQRVRIARKVHSKLQPSSTSKPTLESPVSVIPNARSRFATRNSRSQTPAGVRSKPPTPPAPMTEVDSTHGGAHSKPHPFNYQKWGQERDRQMGTQVAPPAIAPTQVVSQPLKCDRRRGTYENYADSRRFSLLRQHFQGPAFKQGKGFPKPPTETPVPMHTPPRTISTPSRALMVTPDDNDDTPTHKQVSPSNCNGAHQHEMVLAMDPELTAPTSEPATLTTAPTTPHVRDNKPDASPNQDEHDRPSRFELPPAEHPSLSHGSGAYYEYHNGPDGQQTGIGYQFSGSDYMSEMYTYEDGTLHSHADDEHHDCDHDHASEQYDHDQASESDHGDDVGEEEDDPG